MQIVDLKPEHTGYIQQIAEILVEGFREHWPTAWPDLDSAINEVHESFQPERLSRVALDESEKLVLGWIGAIPEYDDLVWELHPLIVRPAYQDQGIGRALVADLEQQLKERGALTLTLGTDDEDYQTSLGGADLYTNLWEQIKNIKNLRHHPYEFYQKLGFTITGVMPDANGIGKPDIFMSKRLIQE